ncbi:MAG: response regulator transcription factor [Candidatus Brocadiia bacterium]
MAKEMILVVEDDEDIQELIAFNLTREGYKVIAVGSGEDGLKIARMRNPDAIILDLMLPGIDGLSLCRVLRADAVTAVSKILMLTAKGEESDVVSGLEVGADDYMAKPFSPKVLVARVRALLRRNVSDADDEGSSITIHGMTIHPGRHELLLDGKSIALTYTEFKVLQFLAKRPGWVFSRYQIVDGVRGDNYPVTDRSVDVQIACLRKKLGKCGKYIETVRGVGYRMKE